MPRSWPDKGGRRCPYAKGRHRYPVQEGALENIPSAPVTAPIGFHLGLVAVPAVSRGLQSKSTNQFS